jgi:diadenosine tetraphosphate (Ap4A) HIT family hydrolase
MSEHECKLCGLLDRYANGEEDMKIVYESEYSLAKYQTEPHKFAEVHIMILSKKHIPSIFDLTANDSELILDIGKAIKVASEEVFALKGGCKLEMYTGTFPTFTALGHFHCHVIYDSSVD